MPPKVKPEQINHSTHDVHGSINTFNILISLIAPQSYTEPICPTDNYMIWKCPYLSADMVKPGSQQLHHRTNPKGLWPAGWKGAGEGFMCSLQDLHSKVCTNRKHQINKTRSTLVFQVLQLTFQQKKRIWSWDLLFSSPHRHRQQPIFDLPQRSPSLSSSVHWDTVQLSGTAQTPHKKLTTPASPTPSTEQRPAWRAAAALRIAELCRGTATQVHLRASPAVWHLLSPVPI